MSSILTNPSAITALESLRFTQQTLASVERQVSTGLKISSAADNASTFAIAQTIRSDQGVLSTITDSLSESSSMLSVASAAVNNVLEVMKSIKNAVAQASDPNADQNKILTQLQGLGQQLISFVAGANFNGLNLLDGSKASISLIASYTDGGGSAASTIGTIDLTTTTLVDGAGGGILEAAQATSSGATTDFTALIAGDLASGAIGDTLSNADKAIADLTNYAATLGSTQTSVTAQGNFIKTLNDALTQGVSSLVDADLNEVSSRLQALQAQQQLGVQSLSIANQSSQVILNLFRQQ
ncbi:MAG: flagellin [Methylocystis sp.]|nr:flagellin [Methylocystis sp.]